MKIIISKYIGPCFGISDALSEVFSKKKSFKIFGEIAHNEHIIEKISKMQNVKIINNTNEANFGDTIIIRSHGISNENIIKLRNKYINIIDKTCPNVKFVHKIAEKCSIENKQLIIVGNENHPEVVGIKSRCLNSVVISNLCDIDNLSNFKSGNFVVSQTTFSFEKYKEICEKLSKKIENLKIYNTICNDALNRRNEIALNLKNFDMVVVIGSKKSSNSTKLFEFAKFLKEKSVMISNISDIERNMFMDVNSIFITSGSSVMMQTVCEIIEIIKTKTGAFVENFENF